MLQKLITIILFTLFSMITFAESLKVPALKGTIHNYSAQDLSKTTVVVSWYRMCNSSQICDEGTKTFPVAANGKFKTNGISKSPAEGYFVVNVKVMRGAETAAEVNYWNRPTTNLYRQLNFFEQDLSRISLYSFPILNLNFGLKSGRDFTPWLEERNAANQFVILEAKYEAPYILYEYSTPGHLFKRVQITSSQFSTFPVVLAFLGGDYGTSPLVKLFIRVYVGRKIVFEYLPGRIPLYDLGKLDDQLIGLDDL